MDTGYNYKEFDLMDRMNLNSILSFSKSIAIRIFSKVKKQKKIIANKFDFY